MLGTWVVITAALGATLAPQANSVLKGGGYTASSSSSITADKALDSKFMESGTKNAIVVLTSSTLTVDDAGYKDQVLLATSKLESLASVRGVHNYYNTLNPGLVNKDRHTTLLEVALKGDDTTIQQAIPDVRDKLAGITIRHWVTGRPAVDYDLIVQSKKDLEHSELITIPLILVLLLIVFRTVISALTPLVLGITSIVMATSLIFLVGSVAPTSVFALNVGSMLGLGLSIDYALFIVSRYRFQRAAGFGPEEALISTMATAGRSITYSGLTVMLGMLALAVLTIDIGIIRSIGIAVLLVAGAAVAAALTLLPALLAVLGDRIEWLRVLPKPRPKPPGEGIWYRLSQMIMRRPWAWLLAGLLVLFIMAIPVHDLKLGRGGTTTHDESRDGLDVVTQSFGGNQSNPILVVVDSRTSNGVWTPQFLEALDRLTTNIKSDPRVLEVSSLSTAFASLPHDQYLKLTASAYKATPLAKVPLVDADAGNDMAVVTIVPRFAVYDDRTESLVSDLRLQTVPASNLPSAYGVNVGGETAITLDYKDLIGHRFPFIVATVMVMIFLILMMFFQSLALPAKAMLLNLASVLATFGALVFIFQYGYGTKLMGFDSFHQISAVTPTILYVTIFALSTDYEVFMLSRVKEFFGRTRNNEESVAAGLQQTAGVITAAALILVGTFGSFATGDALAIKEIGVGLAIGVLLDATLVRVVLVPATMRLMGAGNWYMPAWLRKIIPEISEGEAPPASPLGRVAAAISRTMVLPVYEKGTLPSYEKPAPTPAPARPATAETMVMPTIPGITGPQSRTDGKKP